jgi:acetoin utilization deacetylase AcuC-like enzyme
VLTSVLTYIHHPQFLLHEMGPGHPECPERLSAIENELSRRAVNAALNRCLATPATRDMLLRAHSAEQLGQVQAASDMITTSVRYAMIDPDTIMNQHTLNAAILAAGAGVLAVDKVLATQSGSSAVAQRAFCAVRPPGHHAERDRAMGFCFYNNIAVAAMHSLDHYGLKRVAIVDFDVHHGNGTENIMANDERVLMLSTFQSPFYPYSGVQALGENMVNVALAEGSGVSALKTAVLDQWADALIEFKPELIFISAGFDAHRLDPLGGLAWDTADYAWVTQWLVEQANQHCGGKIVSMLEGGYHLDALAQSVCAHIEALAK